MQMQECLTSKKGEKTASPLFKKSITDRRKVNTKFTVANKKATPYMLQHNRIPKYSVLYFLPIVHTLPILRLFCGFAVFWLGFLFVFKDSQQHFQFKKHCNC